MLCSSEYLSFHFLFQSLVVLAVLLLVVISLWINNFYFVLHLLSDPKMFAPQGRYSAPINVKFSMGSTPMPNFTFIRAEMWKYGPQNCQNLEFCPLGATHLHNFYEILSICMYL